ncbi:MAG: hypothetical protein Kow00122_03760 [Thermoleophilia bacterium]
MLAEKKRATNIGIGGGLLLELVALGLILSRSVLMLLVLPLMLVIIGLFTWGCWSYAQGKGYPGPLGLLGVLGGLPGLIVLVILPDKCKQGAVVSHPPTASSVSYASPVVPPAFPGTPADRAPSAPSGPAGGTAGRPTWPPADHWSLRRPR